MKKEIFLNLIFMILISLFSFVQNKYFVNYMGIETLGMMKLFSQLLAYLNIIEMGIGGASAYALYKPLTEKDYKKTNIIINTMESIYNRIGIILFVLGIICIPFIQFFINIDSFSIKIYLYWILYVSNTVITYLFIKYVILFTANQEYLYVKKVQTFTTILFKLLQIIFIIKYHSFPLYILLLICDNILQWILFKKHCLKNYSYLEKTKERYEGIRNDIKNIFWHKIGGLVVFNTDLILISKFTSLEIVGIYASYQMILQVLGNITAILKGILTPRIGRFIAKHTKEENYDYYRKMDILYCYMAIFFTYSTFILIEDFIILWLGKEFILSRFTLKLICFNLWVNMFRWNLEMFKSGDGFFNDIKSPILESIINFLVSIILGIKLGLDGVIIGTIVSNIIIILIYKPILVFNRCFNKTWKEYIKIYSNYFVITLVSLRILNYIISFFIKINITSWTNWIIYAIEVSIIVLLVITVSFLPNRYFRKGIREVFFKE